MAPKRVLHCLFRLGSGGAETLIMNLYRAMDRDKIQFDFAVRSQKVELYQEEIEKLGGHIYFTPEFPKNVLENYRQMERIMRERQYQAVHIHANSLIYIKPLDIAKKMGIPVRIIHSHNTRAANHCATLLHYINRGAINHSTVYHLACSEVAGKWMFGNRSFTIFHNAVDVIRFQQKNKTRAQIRALYGLEDMFVVGHVGRFVYQKNHPFLIDIFEALHSLCPNARLMLVGSGEGEERIRKIVRDKGLSEFVIFAGVHENVEDFYNAFDVLLLPSLFEGLPFVLVEAQVSGLPCVVSDIVSREAAVAQGLLQFISLQESAERWAEAVLSYGKGYKRYGRETEILAAGYDITYNAKLLEEIYLGIRELPNG